MTKYYSLVTQAGLAAEANAKGLGQKVELTTFAIGDSSGNEYDPSGTETALKNEVYRGDINEIIFDPSKPNQFIVEGVVPQNRGGFTVREAAVFTKDGTLYGIAKYPPSFKTTVDSGASSELKVRIIFASSNTSTVNLTVDPSSVLTTRNYVDERFSFTQVKQNADAERNKEHVFTAHAVLQLKAEADGSWVTGLVDDSVDLSAGECRFKAPTGEKLIIDGKSVDFARFTETNKRHKLRRIKGSWKND